jgi:hypothetical protein
MEGIGHYMNIFKSEYPDNLTMKESKLFNKGASVTNKTDVQPKAVSFTSSSITQ